MEQSLGKITIRHLQSIIQSPQRRPIRVADPRKATATRRIGFEHDERFTSGERYGARVQERLDDLLAGGVV